VASETTQQAAACSSSACYYNTTLSFRDAHSPLPVEYNPRKIFAALFGEGDTPEERAAISNQTRSLLDRISAYPFGLIEVEELLLRGYKTVPQRLRPLEVLDIWLDAGIRLVQLRAKTLPSGEILALADDIAGRCQRAGALFVVNDRADVARLCGADGVHVGQGDLAADRLRAAGIDVVQDRCTAAEHRLLGLGRRS